MKILLIGLGLLVIAMLAGVGTLAITRHAPTALARETRSVSDFRRVEVDGLAQVRLVQGDSESVVIEAASVALPRIRTEVHNGTLTIVASEPRPWWRLLFAGKRAATPRITLNVVQLDKLASAGAVDVIAGSFRANDLLIDFAGAGSVKIADLRANKLRVDGSGAIKIEIAGRVQRQEIDISGAGSYRGAGLASDSAVVEVSGAGKAIVNATTSLKVDLSGAGVVEYLGNPKLEQDVSGVGTIRRHPDATSNSIRPMQRGAHVAEATSPWRGGSSTPTSFAKGISLKWDSSSASGMGLAKK